MKRAREVNSDVAQWWRDCAIGKDAEFIDLVGPVVDLVRQVSPDISLREDAVSVNHIGVILDTLSELDVDAETLAAASVHHLRQHDEALYLSHRDALDVTVRELTMELAKVARFNTGRKSLLAADSPEGLRRLLLAMVHDVRVVLVVLAEQLACMRALAKGPERLRMEYARATSHIYAPLANRLGIWQIKWELEDLSFRYLHPGTYKRIATMLAERRADRESFISEAVSELETQLSAAGIPADVAGRPKHIYSIWRKMHRKGLSFHELYDVRALRILVPDVTACYAVLGLVHGKWQHIPGEFDDYIATPKGNNYQSLHTAVVGPEGKTVEVQIRTFEMHSHAEQGVAAHWRYKDGSRPDPGFDRKIKWMRHLLDSKETAHDDVALLAEFREDVSEDRVYALTPQGKVIDLESGSTVLDFAYRVHTEVGHRCIGAKVNGRIVQLSHPVCTGERVEILTRKNSQPSRDWLSPQSGYLHGSRARAKVRQWFKKTDRRQNLREGRELLEKEFNRMALNRSELEKLPARFNFSQLDELFVAVGQGDLTVQQVVRTTDEWLRPKSREFIPVSTAAPTSTASTDGIIVHGVGDLMSNLGRCCKPVPGDPISGYITQGRGVTIHRSDCNNIKRLQSQHSPRLVEVSWGGSEQGNYPVDVLVSAYDRKGLLRDLSTTLANAHTQVASISSQSQPSRGEIDFRFRLKVDDYDHLSVVLGKLRSLPNVTEVRRVV